MRAAAALLLLATGCAPFSPYMAVPAHNARARNHCYETIMAGQRCSIDWAGGCYEHYLGFGQDR